MNFLQHGSARLKYDARVAQSSSSSGCLGCTWVTMDNLQAVRVGHRLLYYQLLMGKTNNCGFEILRG